MGLEAAVYVGDLVTANPDGGDGKFEGDNHIRLLKSVLQATFPGMAGRSWRSQTKSSGYTVVVNDNMTLFNCTTALTLSLTAAATLGNGHMFFVHANGVDVVIDPNGGELINGVATIVVTNGTCVLVVCDGSAFKAFSTPLVSPWSTGDIKATFKTVADTGWVLMNDGTIGNAASGGTTRAHADTEALFTLLWNNTTNANCAVSSGRGASAAADFAANKNIALPKALGRDLAISGAGSGLTSRALAEASGTETKTIATTHLPASGLSIPGLSIPSLSVSGSASTSDGTAGGANAPIMATNVTINSSTPVSGTGTGTTGTGTTGNMGTGGALDVMNPRFHANVMIKL